SDVCSSDLRCPEAHFSLQDTCTFSLGEPVDLVTCFLYSVHYGAGIDRLKACIASVHGALAAGGLFCFNAVDKDKIDNALSVSHAAEQIGRASCRERARDAGGGGRVQKRMM